MQKKDILSKIQTLFYNKSFTKVSMNEIAHSLQIQKASLYYYFPSKEVLI
jgi:AcrR family transcriptional regulator